ncbi:sugar ABC transporter substrate-binding protein [Streptomyces sp. AC512_CC834]|uniref:sugar ABC transporter substrate-binding protein n=1 Tax=Streptomyces sp. AC512_CC834 TaxID=2823691 RepID=UPI001C266079|nr:sugar ABC transporter substrate-binding protein [Streptomyces sp. AC512_CC834]
MGFPLHGLGRWAVAAAVGGSAVLSGCAEGSGSGGGSLTIGFVNGDTSGFATCLQKAVEQEAKTRNVALNTANSQMDAGKELANIEDMISRGVDALIVQTVNIDALEGDIAKARAADVPIYLTSLATEDVSDILGAAAVDLKRLGALDAGWIAEDAGGRPVEVGVIAGSPGASSDLMVSGFTDALPDNASVVANQPGMFNPVKAREVAENMIQAHPGLDYVFVANEDMAFAARKTFDAAGAKGVRIVTENGTDEGLAAVEDGRFSATVANSPKVIGETAVRNTVALLGGENTADGERPDKIARIPLTLITEENVDEAPEYCPE